MKKMNMALFTAAAMVTSSAAFAVEIEEPNFGGRIQVILEEADEDGGEEDLDMNNWHFAASGSATDLVGGIDASYYSRLSSYSDFGEQFTPYVEYASVTFSTPGVDLTVGRTDDLHYQFADSQIFALSPRNYDGLGGADFNTVDSVTLTSDLGGSPVTIGGYFNDRSGNTEDDSAADTTGVQDVQAGVSADLGMGTLAAVYSDTNKGDSERTERVTFAGTFDISVATLAARVSDLDNGATPYTLAAGVPVSDNTMVYIIHGDDDGATGESSDSTGLEARTSMGGGLEVFAGLTDGENQDDSPAENFYAGTRWQF